MAVLGVDGGLEAVAGIDGGVGREGLDEGLEGVDECPEVAAGEVGAADAVLEETVAGEEDFFFFAVVADATGGVAGAGDDGEAVAAEGDDALGGDVLAGGRVGTADRVVEDAADLFIDVVVEGTVGLRTTGRQAVELGDVVGAPEVVEMGVGEQMGYGLEVVVSDVLGDHGFFIVVVGAAVDDDGLAGVVADDVAVLAEGIDWEGFDNHIGKPPSPLKGSVGNET